MPRIEVNGSPSIDVGMSIAAVSKRYLRESPAAEMLVHGATGTPSTCRLLPPTVRPFAEALRIEALFVAWCALRPRSRSKTDASWLVSPSRRSLHRHGSAVADETMHVLAAR